MLHRVTRGYKGLVSLLVVHAVTRGYCGLQGVHG